VKSKKFGSGKKISAEGRKGSATIGEALTALINELGIGRKIREAEAMEMWKKVVGNAIAEVTTPVKIENGKLFVSVSRAAWRNELVYLKDEIKDKINAAMKEEIVKEIVLR
jgi:predicted nucleic acid-binding Zn ribbon protein